MLCACPSSCGKLERLELDHDFIVFACRQADRRTGDWDKPSVNSVRKFKSFVELERLEWGQITNHESTRRQSEKVTEAESPHLVERGAARVCRLRSSQAEARHSDSQTENKDTHTHTHGRARKIRSKEKVRGSLRLEFHLRFTLGPWRKKVCVCVKVQPSLLHLPHSPARHTIQQHAHAALPKMHNAI